MMGETTATPVSKVPRITMLVILALLYGSQYLNLILLGLIIQPIKLAFGLSDTQAGLLTGLAFTAVFVICGVPLARLADRFNRKLIVLASALGFSLATAACGLATGFLSLFITRMIVAVGEAGTVPASVSMLADAFPSRERRLALSFHSCGAYVGTALCLLIVGLAGPRLDWRQTFMVAGAFGVALAVLLSLLVKEPPRAPNAVVSRTIAQDIKTLAKIKPFVFLTLSLGVTAISTSAAINWVPAFLSRSYGMDQRHIVLFLAAVWGIAATSGGIISGFLTNWLYRLGGKWPLLAVGGLMVSFPILCCVAFISTNAATSLLGFAAAIALMGGVRGPSFAAVQDVVPAGCRATANSFLMFSMYAIGVTFGPLLTGAVSDFLTAMYGAEALRHALLIVIVASALVGTILVALAAYTIEHVEDGNAVPA